jgi:hypothetical protein
VLQWRSLRGTELNSAFQSGIAAEPLKRTGMRDVVFGLLARRYRAGQDESREADRWGRSAVATFGWSFASEDFRRGAADDLFLVGVPHSGQPATQADSQFKSIPPTPRRLRIALAATASCASCAATAWQRRPPRRCRQYILSRQCLAVGIRLDT